MASRSSSAGTSLQPGDHLSSSGTSEARSSAEKLFGIAILFRRGLRAWPARRGRCGHDDRVALGLADDLQARLGAEPGVRDDVGEGGDPGDVGLPDAERLDDRGVARRDGGADDEAGVLSHELGELVPAARERSLLDGGDEEHPDDLLPACSIRPRLTRPATNARNRSTARSQPSLGRSAPRPGDGRDPSRASSPRLFIPVAESKAYV
jgi:hypothetical protein